MRKTLLTFILFGFFTSLSAQFVPTFKQVDKSSVRQLEAILMKQSRPRYVFPAEMTMSREVALRWENVQQFIGSKQFNSTGSNKFRAALEWQTDFKYLRAWGQARISFENVLTFNSSTSKIRLPRAFLGYNFVTYGPVTFHTTMGRRPLNLMYESQVMFSTTADGITGYLGYGSEKWGNAQTTVGIYTNGKPFWIVDAKYTDILLKGFYLDYSFIYWGQHLPSDALEFPFQWRYDISQFLIGWDNTPKWLKIDAKISAALLVNHHAWVNYMTNFQPENLGGYVTFQLGRVRKKGDFSFQAQWQLIPANLIPDFDFAGIGRGATVGKSIYATSDIRNANGSTNFNGWELVLQYSLTDDITSKVRFQRSISYNSNIGLPANMSKFSMDMLYNF